jgi:hypothetical protein
MKFSLKYSWVLLLLVLLQAVTWSLGLCGTDRSCEWYRELRNYAFVIVNPVLLYSLYSIPLGIGLLFATQKGFKFLVRFAKWWIPISILVIFFAPENSNAYLPFFELTKGSASTVLGILFSIIGLIVVFRNRK